MNAPLPEYLIKALKEVSLEDKYALNSGRAFMSGVQALVRLPMLQRQRDLLEGKNTAGLISGYRGSPLGAYDQSLWKAKDFLAKENIIFQPGVNEELAATAIWGTQQLGFSPPKEHKFDGVFGIWYGKGPGVDRCADVFKHANMAGTTRWGGVIAIAGDDHIAKSSTAAHQSDQIFMACGMPVFFPSSVQDILDLGVHAFELSRFCGLWSGMKTIQEIVESSATVIIDPSKVVVKIPELSIQLPSGGLAIRWPDDALSQESRLFDFKWAAALAYIKENKLNFNVIESAQDRLGIIASGKAYNDTRQALADLGLTDEVCHQIGIRVHKVNVSWPLEPHGVFDFASGLKEILVVEEKRALIETQLKDELYSWSDSKRPQILGKFDLDPNSNTSQGQWTAYASNQAPLLRASADLNPTIIARAIARRLKALGVDNLTQAKIDQQIERLDLKERAMTQLSLTSERQPWFCSGCPHNTSTVVPEGSRAMAGIGCHFMSLWMDRQTAGFTQMGGEGTPWIGQQPFVNEKHIFANLGDGTYFHSGIMAIRQSVAAGVNITYKILYNDAVAMTGGQPIGERSEGHTVIQIAQSMKAEGVKKVTIVTDMPEKYDEVKELPIGVLVKHRDELDRIQREFREIGGTTVIIYDQTCATEKRRRRKRGTMVDPAVRVMINEEVCEGCGDCGIASNCISVEPLETELGRKRTINQSACNKDLSCLKGFCPSFVTIEGGSLKPKNSKSNASNAYQLHSDKDELPEPVLPDLKKYNLGYGIVVAGVGGTGVITIGQLLGYAAHMEGLGIVTQDSAGLAQKGGATWSHVIIANEQNTIRTTRVSTVSADLVMACDPIVGTSKETILKIASGRTKVVLNRHSSPTAQFVKDRDWKNPSDKCKEDLLNALGGTQADFGNFDAYNLAVKELGDSIYVNPLILGFAWQRGWIPLRRESILRAIELNAVSVEKNKSAFEIGRLAAIEASTDEDTAGEEFKKISFLQREKWATVVANRVQRLTAYQNRSYANSYKEFVDQVHAKLGEKVGLVVAKNLFKLMAYKDEYEVARLHTQSNFNQRIKDMFEGDYKINYHLAPPILAKRNDKGELIKQKMGPMTKVLFRILAPLKFLRATALDPFGKTQERQQERQLIVTYKSLIQELMNSEGSKNLELIIQIANVPDSIKGFGHVKERSIKLAEIRWSKLMEEWRRGVSL
jgi:indolepyruvate ferredoxin oxidoreductase